MIGQEQSIFLIVLIALWRFLFSKIIYLAVTSTVYSFFIWRK
ncbi:hypothetical protein D931_00938 [Enterococcus faecium 13.SD.W.09]|nr:hypothetical protein D931_00938 [Enterococcus faecium 13.SD.W.09]